MDAVERLSKEDAGPLVLGNEESAMFPEELKPYMVRRTFGRDGMKINFLVNYSWEWDFCYHKGAIGPELRMVDVSRIGLVIGGAEGGDCRDFLKVNATKTKVVRPTRSKYLGFTFLKNGGEWKVKPTAEKKKKIKQKLREYLKRNKAVARPLAWI